MRREKIRLVWLVIAVLSLSWAVFAFAGIDASEELTKASVEEQLSSVDDMAIIDMFYKRGIFGNDEDYVHYAEALLHLSKEEFEEAVPLFESLADENFLDCVQYAVYAKGRSAEAEGDIRTAAAHYVNFGFLDSDARWMRLVVDAAKAHSPMQVLNAATGAKALKDSEVVVRDEHTEELQKVKIAASPSPRPSPTSSPTPNQEPLPTSTPVPTLYVDLYLADESTIDIAIRDEAEAIIQYVSIRVIPNDASEWTVDSSTRQYAEPEDKVRASEVIENGWIAVKDACVKITGHLDAWADATKAESRKEVGLSQRRQRME